MYASTLFFVFERVSELGLTDSRRKFAIDWCLKDDGYLYDYSRRGGMNRLIRDDVINNIRTRLADIASVAEHDLADEVRALDEVIVRDAAVARLLHRSRRPTASSGTWA